MLTRIEDIQRDIHTSNRNVEQLISRRSNRTHLDSSVCTKRLKVGFQSVLFSFSVEFSSEQDDRQTKSKTVGTAVKKNICTIRLPSWFVQDQYNLAFARSKNGWLFHPTVYRTVDHVDSPMFEACIDGDLERIKMLLTTNQAFLGDRVGSKNPDIRPEPLLFYALFAKQFEVCELLMNAGILSFFQSCDYVDVLRCFFRQVDLVDSHRNRTREILRLIEHNHDLDPDWIDDLELGSHYYKAIQDLRLYAEVAGSSALDRFEALMFPTVLDFHGDDLELKLHLLTDFLGDADHLREIRAAASRSTWLLFLLAYQICKLSWRYEDEGPPEHAVRDAYFSLSVLCDTELDLHAYKIDLPEAWNQGLYSTLWLDWNSGSVTPFTYIFADHFDTYGDAERLKYRTFEQLNAAIRLWVNALHGAGVNLAAYAKEEIWSINVIVKRASSVYDLTCRLLYGPEPEDWRVETDPPGEAYPVYFWRSVEAAPIGKDLAAKVLDLMRRVEHPEAMHCDVPGSWTRARDDLYNYTWIIKAWLAYMEDRDLAQIEVDLERLDAKEFYDLWDLSSVIDEWYDEEGTEGSGCTESSEDFGDPERPLYEGSEWTECSEDPKDAEYPDSPLDE
jgi:hypothetical protein